MHEVMGWPGPMTHRQWETWRVWREKQRSVPSKTDWYIIQLTDEVRGVLGRHEKLEKYVLRWTQQGGVRTQAQVDAARLYADQMAKYRWGMAMGVDLNAMNGSSTNGATLK